VVCVAGVAAASDEAATLWPADVAGLDEAGVADCAAASAAGDADPEEAAEPAPDASVEADLFVAVETSPTAPTEPTAPAVLRAESLSSRVWGCTAADVAPATAWAWFSPVLRVLSAAAPFFGFVAFVAALGASAACGLMPRREAPSLACEASVDRGAGLQIVELAPAACGAATGAAGCAGRADPGSEVVPTPPDFASANASPNVISSGPSGRLIWLGTGATPWPRLTLLFRAMANALPGRRRAS
jgi:hypothetical protein